MTRAKKIEEYLSYPYTPEIQLEHPSGWCMTNYHDGCKYQFNHGRCGCTCHTQIKQQKTQIEDPRPWRKNE
jgi:hypothetical protein